MAHRPLSTRSPCAPCRYARPCARWGAKYAQAVADGGGYPGLPGLAAGAWNTPDGKAKQEFEFYEQMLRTVEQKDPSGRGVHNHLTSESGRVYLFLAHASGRLR